MSFVKLRHVEDFDGNYSISIPMYYDQPIFGWLALGVLCFFEANVQVAFFLIIICHDDSRRNGQVVFSLDHS